MHTLRRCLVQRSSRGQMKLEYVKYCMVEQFDDEMFELEGVRGKE